MVLLSGEYQEICYFVTRKYERKVLSNEYALYILFYIVIKAFLSPSRNIGEK
jgi:hypothetical protein